MERLRTRSCLPCLAQRRAINRIRRTTGLLEWWMPLPSFTKASYARYLQPCTVIRPANARILSIYQSHTKDAPSSAEHSSCHSIRPFNNPRCISEKYSGLADIPSQMLPATRYTGKRFRWVFLFISLGFVWVKCNLVLNIIMFHRNVLFHENVVVMKIKFNFRPNMFSFLILSRCPRSDQGSKREDGL